MTRIATFSQSQALGAEMMRLQQQQFKTQQQIATGKEGQTFKDIAKDANVLLSAKGYEARLENYSRASDEVTARLEIQDVHLESLYDLADGLRQEVMTAVANESGIVTMEKIEQTFRSAVNILNQQVDGKFIYGGTRTDVEPVSTNSIDDLIAAASSDDLFENNALKQSVQVDDTQTIEFGILADEIAGDLFAAMKRIAEYDDGANGPLGESLTEAQKTYLQSEIGNLKSIAQGINEKLSRNGLNHQEVQTTRERHETSDVFIKGFISDIEDVDLAEAVSRLNNDQVAVEAATRIVAQLGRLSLLDFI